MRRPSPLPVPRTPERVEGHGPGPSPRDHSAETAPLAAETPGLDLPARVLPTAVPEAGVGADEQVTEPLELGADPGAKLGGDPGEERRADAGEEQGEVGDSPPADEKVSGKDVRRAARARRRALRGEVRRFTERARRRRVRLIIAGVSLVVLAVATVGAAYSPLFALERVHVIGTRTLPAADVEAALAGQLGTPLALIDESAIKSVLVEFPLVESYTLEARPPHDLVVRLVERTPIGVIESRAGWSIVDAAGVVLETTETAPEGRAVISAARGVDSPAFESIALVMRALPEGIVAQVSHVAATTRDDVTLTLGSSGARVMWGSASESALKSVVLETAMRARPPEGVSVYDVSSPSAVVIR